MVNEYKICKKCNDKKLYPDEFIGIGRFVCKKCRNLALKAKRISKRKPKQSKEEKLLKIKEWQKNNSDKRKAAVSKYHATHSVEEKQYYIDNRQKIIARIQKWRADNKTHTNEWVRLHRQDPVIGLRHAVSVLIRHCLNDVKSGSVIDYLPYTIQDLKEYLENQFESWMTWENWVVYRSEDWYDNDPSTWKWQLDHIIPHSHFKYELMEDQGFKDCWALSNLRPLSAKQNLLENNRKI